MLILVVGRIEFPAVEGRRVPFLAGGSEEAGNPPGQEHPELSQEADVRDKSGEGNGQGNRFSPGIIAGMAVARVLTAVSNLKGN